MLACSVCLKCLCYGNACEKQIFIMLIGGLTCGPDLANKIRPPKCHHSILIVGQIWATAITYINLQMYLGMVLV